MRSHCTTAGECAGWCDRAEAVMAAAPRPMHHATPPPPAADVVESLRPVSHSNLAPMMHPDQEAAVGTWRGSLVAASSLRPPQAGATLTPVQVAVAGVFDLPPGERRARVASLAAAAKLVAYMSAHQVNALLGRPDSLVIADSASSLRYCPGYTYYMLWMGSRHHRWRSPHLA